LLAIASTPQVYGLALITKLGPFCQISILPTALPQGLSDPHAYSPPELPCPSFAALNQAPHGDSPPTYASISRNRTTPHDSKPPHTSLPAPDVLHFIGPFDTLQSLSLAYSTPVSVLRSTNNLFSDHLLAARRTILVPGEFYKGGVSLSPRPVEGEEEEIRRGKIRRWMVACKVAEYVQSTIVSPLSQFYYNMKNNGVTRLTIKLFSCF
jgi:hypothetical protein